MCNAEGGENAADKAQHVTKLHHDRNELHHVHHDNEEAPSNEVEEEREDLGVDV